MIGSAIDGGLNGCFGSIAASRKFSSPAAGFGHKQSFLNRQDCLATLLAVRKKALSHSAETE